MTDIISITPVYAGILALLFVALSLQVAMFRVRNKISVGDGNDPGFNILIRLQGNFAEYIPSGLFLMLLIELQGGHGLLLHVLGIMLLAGRVAHISGMRKQPSIVPLRAGGMVLTFTALIIAALTALWLALF